MKILTLLFTLIIGNAVCQQRPDKYGRLNKKEFAEIKKQKQRFIPSDLKDDTVIVVRYSVARLEKLNATSRNLEFVRNGEDTTGYTDEFLFGKTQVEKERRILEKRSAEFPKEQSIKLNKKGIKTIIVDETMLLSNKRYQEKYWLTTIYITIQSRLRGSWISYMGNQFCDPRTGKYYETLKVLNHDIMEFVE